MSGSAGFVGVSLDLKDVEVGLANLKLKDRLFSKAFRALTPAVKSDQKDHAAKRAGPEGSWASRATKTIDRMTHGGRRIKKPMGRLLAAVAYKATSKSISAVSRVAWSGAQQDGEAVGRGHRSRLPARPFLWASDKLLAAAVEHFANAYLGGFGGA